MQDALWPDIGEPVGGAGPMAESRRAHVRQARVFRQVREETLLPTDLLSLIPSDDACIWIRRGLELVDLSPVHRLYCDRGGIPYDPRPLLGIMLYAYYEGDTGSRTIAKRCQRDVCYMHVGCGEKPEASTLRRFRRRIAPVLDELFVSVVR